LHDEVVLGDGTTLERHSTPLIDQNGAYHGRIWEFINVTERVQREESLYDAYSTIESQYEELMATEEALRHQYAVLKETENTLETKNNLLSALLETATHGILSIDSDLRVHHYNKRFIDMWNLSEDAIYLGADGWEIIKLCMEQALNPDQFITNAEMIIASQDNILNIQIHLREGKVFRSFSAPIHGLDGTCHGKLWKLIDITDDLLQQQKLERACAETILRDNQLTLVLESTGGGLWTWDTSTDLFTLNPEFISRYPSLSESQTLCSFISTIHLNKRDECLKFFHEMTEDCHINFEFQLQALTGMWHWFALRGIVYDVDDDGFPLIVAGILMDVTEHKQYESHLRKSN